MQSRYKSCPQPYAPKWSTAARVTNGAVVWWLPPLGSNVVGMAVPAQAGMVGVLSDAGGGATTAASGGGAQ